MTGIEKLSGKKVLVLGSAKSGEAAARLLHAHGAEVTVNDMAKKSEREEALEALGIQVICGGHPQEVIESTYDLIVKNPGIPYKNPVLQSALEKGTPIWTEIELAYLATEAPIIAITGSNGKTTTTTLLYYMLHIGKKKPTLAGNIGTVASSVAPQLTEEELLILEVSSFQLMGIEAFKPRIAIWTNIYDAHLDFHGSREAYIEAKAQITSQQTEEDYFIYNADQPELVEIAKATKATAIPFTVKGKATEGISVDENDIYWQGEKLIARESIQLPGEHNLENIAAATAAALLVSCDRDSIHHVLSSFTGVKHRMQFVKEWKGVRFYNDSKATNTLATKSALSSFEQPIHLIAGGLDREHSFEPLRPHMKHVNSVAAIGETKKRFASFAKEENVAHIHEATTMYDAVEKVLQHVEPGDIVLLSPACASWDEYKSFEERGDEFIKAVQQLTE